MPASPLFVPVTGEARCSTKLEQFRALAACKLDGVAETRLGRAVVADHCLQNASQPKRVGLDTFFARCVHKVLGLDKMCQSNLRLPGHPVCVSQPGEQVWNTKRAP